MAKNSRPDKLSLIIASGEIDRIHYALVMASAALAVGTPVTLFFTNWACRAMQEGAGWKSRPLSAVADLPDTTGSHTGGSTGGPTGEQWDETLRANGVGGFEELMSACSELGAKFMACEMGLKVAGMKRDELRTDIDWEVGGVVSFLNDAEKHGQVIYL